MNKLFYILTIIVFVITNRLQAQDIHYSQFDSSPLNLNPALSGAFEGDFRFAANQRTQWLSVTSNPYRTISTSFDSRFNNRFVKGSQLGVGLQFNSDKAGDSEFGTTQIRLSGAWHQAILSDNSLVVSFGLDGGYTQNSINYTNLHFGNQYDGNIYDPTLSNDETYVENQLGYMDLTLGANVMYKLNQSIPINIGIDFTHLNQPEKSFYANTSIELDRKFNLYGIAHIPVTHTITLVPSFLYMDQGRYKEVDMGGLLKVNLDNVAFRAIYLGGWGRLKDAGVVKVGLDYNNVNVGISYDINTSSLRVASNGRGGLELSVIYIFNRPRSVDLPDTKKCPTFI